MGNFETFLSNSQDEISVDGVEKEDDGLKKAETSLDRILNTFKKQFE